MAGVSRLAADVASGLCALFDPLRVGAVFVCAATRTGSVFLDGTRFTSTSGAVAL